MTADRHTCPDCGASHKRLAPKTPKRRKLASATDLAPKKCPRCHTPVIAGRIDAQDRTLDPRPLNETGALALRGRRDIASVRGLRATLIDPVLTRWPPQPGTRWHAAHDCQRPVPHELGNAIVDRTRRTHRPQTETPPF